MELHLIPNIPELSFLHIPNQPIRSANTNHKWGILTESDDVTGSETFRTLRSGGDKHCKVRLCIRYWGSFSTVMVAAVLLANWTSSAVALIKNMEFRRMRTLKDVIGKSV